MPITGVGVKPDGSIVWIDDQGHETNSSGGPVSSTVYPSINPADTGRPTVQTEANNLTAAQRTTAGLPPAAVDTSGTATGTGNVSSTASTSAPTTGNTTAAPSGAGISRIPTLLGHPDWSVVQGSIHKVPSKTLIDNPDPNAGSTDAQGNAVPSKIPDPSKSTWEVTMLTPDGQNPTVEVKPGAVINNKSVDDPSVNLENDVVWTAVGSPANVSGDQSTGGHSTALATANTQLATAQAQLADAQNKLTQSNQEQAQRQKNQDAGKGYLTDAEVAELDDRAAKNNLTQQQVDNQRTEIGNNNKNTEISNQIAAQNAATQAAAAQSEAQQRIITEQVALGQLNQDQAKFEWQKIQDEKTQALAEGKLKLDQLTQQQTNQTQQAQTAETGRHNVATETQAQNELAQSQRTAEQQAQASAAQTAQQAAGSILSSTQQGAQTGAGLINQRVQAATSMLNQVLGLAGGGKLGPGNLAGVGANLTQGIAGYTAELAGGQSNLDTAARLVQQADPSSSQYDPATQHAVGVLTQMLDKYQQMTGTLPPAARAVQSANGAAAASVANRGLTAPATVTASGGSNGVVSADQVTRQAAPAAVQAQGPLAPNEQRAFNTNAQGQVQGVASTGANQPNAAALANYPMGFTAPALPPPPSPTVTSSQQPASAITINVSHGGP
jgi:hypothetical protein